MTASASKYRPKPGHTPTTPTTPTQRRAKKKDPNAGAAILAQLPAAPQERNEAEVMDFLKAIDTFKRKSGKLFPSWSDILDIVKTLGYRKH